MPFPSSLQYMLRCIVAATAWLHLLLPSNTQGWTLSTPMSCRRTTTTTCRSQQVARRVSRPNSIFRGVLLQSQKSKASDEEEVFSSLPEQQQELPLVNNDADDDNKVSAKPTKTTSTATIAPPEILFGNAIDTDDGNLDDIVDDETPAGIVGAQFFGGNKQKEELYDPVAEREATVEEWTGFYDRFATLESELVGPLCQSLQQQLLQALQRSDVTKKQLQQQQKQLQQQEDVSLSTTTLSTTTTPNYYYSPNVKWETPFATTTKGGSTSSNPLQALQQAKEFYNRLDVGIVSGQRLSNDVVELQWEISVAWPTFWEPRVLVTGSSQLTVDVTTRTIVRQVDTLHVGSNDVLLPLILDQLVPRIWDIYHIGMTPSAELAPRINVPSSSLLPKSYKVSELPSRWVLQPTRLDTGDRDDAVAQMIPNHAFTTLIKTVGPQRERFVPTSPIQVQIVQPTQQQQQLSVVGDKNDSSSLAAAGSTAPSSTSPLIIWKIPLSVEFLSQARWPLPGDDEEADEGSQPACNYVLDPRRRIATIPFGKSPQDPDVAQARKRLYEAVMRDGTFQPKLDAAGRPQFFYLQHDCKSCFTVDGGLGMNVYDWRPEWAQTNEIGIELEL